MSVKEERKKIKLCSNQRLCLSVEGSYGRVGLCVDCVDWRRNIRSAGWYCGAAQPSLAVCGAQQGANFPLVGRLVGPQPAVQSNTGHTTTQCSYNFSTLSHHTQILSNLSNPSYRFQHHPVLQGLCCRACPVVVILVVRTDTITIPSPDQTHPCLLKVSLPARFPPSYSLWLW